jgi:hypothetical protein
MVENSPIHTAARLWWRQRSSKVKIFSSAVCHDILEFSARVLAIWGQGLPGNQTCTVLTSWICRMPLDLETSRVPNDRRQNVLAEIVGTSWLRLNCLKGFNNLVQ